MSVSELFDPNYYDLYCNTLTVKTGVIVPSADTAIVATFDGVWASPQSGTINATRTGNTVTLNLPEIVTTGTINSYISMTVPATLPAQYTPASTLKILIPVINSNDGFAGLIVITSGGLISIYANPYSESFVGNNDTGFLATSITYNVN